MGESAYAGPTGGPTKPREEIDGGISKCSVLLSLWLMIAGCDQVLEPGTPTGSDGALDAASDAGASRQGSPDGPAADLEVGVDSSEAPNLASVEAGLYASCAFEYCHDGGNLLVDLRTGRSHAATVGIASVQVSSMSLIEPGSLERSYLYRKIVGTHAEACEDAGVVPNVCGASMPISFLVLRADVAEFEAWVLSGAPR